MGGYGRGGGGIKMSGTLTRNVCHFVFYSL